MEKNEIRVLVTGFVPFGDDKVNPTQTLAESFDGKRFDSVSTYGRVLPCSFMRIGKILETFYQEIEPDIVINLGLKSGGKGINLERIALNMMDPPMPDNDGYSPVDMPINGEADLAYLATLPIRKIVENMRIKGIPAIISNNAGLFTCNCAMFHTLYLSTTKGIPKIGGFIHIPYFPEDIANKLFNFREIIPSMSFETQL